MARYFKRIAGAGGGNYICFWKSKGVFSERINSTTISTYTITPKLIYYGNKIKNKI